MSEELKFCVFCQAQKPADSFKPVFRKGGKRRVIYKCGDCRKLAKLPQEVRDARGKAVSVANAKQLTRLNKQRHEEKIQALRTLPDNKPN